MSLLDYKLADEKLLGKQKVYDFDYINNILRFYPQENRQQRTFSFI